MNKDEFRAVARLDKKTYDRLQKVSEATGISASDLVRLGIKCSLPQWESGQLSAPELKKAA